MYALVITIGLLSVPGGQDATTKFYIPYESSFTCEAGMEQAGAHKDAFATVAKKLRAPRRYNPVRFEADCALTNVRI
jgi:hypothetical protein